MTPEQIAKHILRPDSDVGSRVRAHLSPPLLEDLEQTIAGAIRDVERRQRERSLASVTDADAMDEDDDLEDEEDDE